MENKPKISGVAFNAYAIVGLLVITPIYLALVTSVAAGGTIEDKRYSMLPEDGYVRTDYTDTALHPGYFKTNGNNAIGTWIDIGDNMTQNYINEYEAYENIIDNKRKEENRQSSLEILYEQLQLPIIVALLYFLFHLPIVNNWFIKTFKSFFHSDGNMNLSGYVLKSIVFASLYHIIYKGVKYSETF